MAVNLQLRAELPEDAIVFDYDKMIEELMQDEEWSYEEAAEWIDYNTIRSIPYAGENAPIIMYRL